MDAVLILRLQNITFKSTIKQLVFLKIKMCRWWKSSSKSKIKGKEHVKCTHTKIGQYRCQ